MAEARLGGRNSFAIYWLKLVTLGTIRFLVEVQVDFLGTDVALKIVLIWFLFFHVGFRTRSKLFILKVTFICTHIFFKKIYTFCKSTACIPLLF